LRLLPTPLFEADDVACSEPAKFTPPWGGGIERAVFLREGPFPKVSTTYQFCMMLHHSLPSKRVHLPSYTIETRETQKRLDTVSPCMVMFGQKHHRAW
jgi:hypothetical protein